MTDKSINKEVTQLRAKLTALEQLLAVQEQTTLEQSEKLERALESLQESEERYRSLYTKTPAMLHSIDKSGHIVDVNDHWLAVLGYERDEVVGHKQVEFMTPEASRYAETVDIPRFMKTGHSRDVAYQFVKKDGQILDILLSAAEERDKEGRFVRSLAILTDVTERKQTEKALRESEVRYKAVFDSAPVAIYTKDKQGVYTSANPDTLQYWFQNPVGHTDIELLEPDIGQALREHDLMVMESGQEQVLEEKIRGPDGLRVVLSRKVPLYDVGGNVIGILGTSVDITERKRAEEMLHDVTLSSADWIWEIDAQGRYTYCSERVVDVLGYTAEEMLNQTPFDSMPPPEAERVAAIFTKIITHKQPIVDLENRNLTKDGREVIMLTNGVPVLDREGNLLGYRGVDRDITERRQAEETLRESEERFRQVISSISAHIYVTEITKDGEQINHYISPNVKDLTGYPLEKFLADWSFWPSELIHPDDRTGAGAQAARLAKGRSSETEYRMTRADGEIIWVRDSARVEKDAAQQSLMVYGIVSDITGRKKIDEMLTKRAAELETVAQVSAAASTTLEANRLMQQVVELTKTSFGLYHAQIYLLGENEGLLKIAAGAGEVGRQMVAEAWRIPLKQAKSLVARAARSRRGVIVNDVRADPDFLSHSLLPHTRAELAVPMLVGDKVLGVLDVQADVVNYFTDEDARIQTTLAAQVAVALQNANLYEQSQKHAAQLERLALIESTLSQATDEEEILTALTLAIDLDRLTCNASLEYVEANADGPPANAYLVAWWHDGMIRPDNPRLHRRYELSSLPTSKLWLESPQQVLLISDVPADPRAGEDIRQYAAQLDCQAIAFLPLHSGGHWQGVVTFTWAETHPFSPDERFYLQQLVDPVGAVVASRRAYLAQQEATTFLDSVVNNIPSGIFVKAAEDLRFVQWNKANEALVGLKKEEVLDKNDYDFFPEEEADFFVAKDREVLAGGELLDIPEEPIQTAHLGIRLLHTRKVPILGPDGKARYLLGISEDITERKQAEEALRQARARAETLYRISHGLNAARDEEELLQVMAQPATEAGAFSATLQYIDLDEAGEMEWIEIVAIWQSEGEPSIPVGSRFYLPEFPFARLWFSNPNEPQFIADVATDEQIDENLMNMLVQSGTVSLVTVPLTRAGRWVGIITFNWIEPHEFSEQETTIYNALVSLASPVVAGRRLFGQMQQASALLDKRVKELDCLSKIGQKTVETPPIAEFLQQVTEYIPPAMQYPDACLTAIEFEGQLYGAPETVKLPRQVVQGIRAGGEAIGQVYIAYTEEHDFLDEESALLGDITRRVTGYIENQRLFDQTQAILTETRALYEISRALTTATNLNEALGNMLITLNQHGVATGADSITLTTMDVDQAGRPAWAEVRAWWSYDDRPPPYPIGTRFPIQGGTLTELWTSDPSNPILFGDIQTDERLDETTRQQYLQAGTPASVMLPLWMAGHWVGLLNLSWTETQVFKARDQRLYRAFMGQFATLVESQRLFDQTQAALAETELLYNAGRKINEADDLQEIAAAIAEAVPISAINRAVLLTFEYDPAGEVETMTVAANWHNGQGTPPTPIGTRYPRQIFSTVGMLVSREPIFFDDALHDERADPATLAVLKSQNILATAILPLWTGARQLGVLFLQAEEVHHFSELETRPYIALADQVAVAIENQHLLEQTRARARREQILRQVTNQVRSAVDVDTIMRTAAQEVGRALKRPAFVYLGDEEGEGDGDK